MLHKLNTRHRGDCRAYTTASEWVDKMQPASLNHGFQPRSGPDDELVSRPTINWLVVKVPRTAVLHIMQSISLSQLMTSSNGCSAPSCKPPTARPWGEGRLFSWREDIHTMLLFNSYSHSKNLCVYYSVTTFTMKPSTVLAILSLTSATSAMFIPSTVYLTPFPTLLSKQSKANRMD